VNYIHASNVEGVDVDASRECSAPAHWIALNIYIYMCVCVCVCVLGGGGGEVQVYTAEYINQQ
jgi:hypothetical protein